MLLSGVFVTPAVHAGVCRCFVSVTPALRAGGRIGTLLSGVSVTPAVRAGVCWCFVVARWCC